MNKANILAFLDAEIERLQRARQLLSGSNSVGQNGDRGGKANTRAGGRRRRHMSAEARRRISEAQKKRWAKRKKAGR